MKHSVALSIHLATAGIIASVIALPNAAAAQDRTLSLPAQPLRDALEKIATWSGKPVNIDPDAVKGLTSRPVSDARDADDAVTQATRGLPIARDQDADGNPTVANDILVVARRDEAETSVLVRSATTSSRLGQSLRDQARNTQVISSKLLKDQQAQTLSEALTNAGGVVLNQATVQGGVSFSVRGFSSNGAINGLPSAGSSSFASGATQSLANIERIEVLKGPDAILLGGDSLGGTINIVTKKPSIEERLYVSGDTGSFGLIRGTIDANRAISADNRWSARIIATAASADRNFGGYRGNEDYLFAPSLRYKNGVTDVVLSSTFSTQIFGMVPYTVLNPATGKPYNVAFNRPLLGGREQFTRNGNTQVNLEVTQKVTDWLTVVARGQHTESRFSLAQYSPFALLAPGLLLVNSSGVRQQLNMDVVDTYARANFDTGVFNHKIVAGYTHLDNRTSALDATDGTFLPYPFLTPTALPPLANRYSFSNSEFRKQDGFYGQYQLGFWKVHLVAGLRHNKTDVLSTIANRNVLRTTRIKTDITTPNYGAVVDITDKFSVFGTLAYGFLPTFNSGVGGIRLPDIKTRNAETGIKWDLFEDRMVLNASYFSIRESNRIRRIGNFDTATPGILGRGIDINLSGEPIRGLSIVAAYTRTNYRFLSFDPRIGGIVNAQPRDVYSLYSSYRHTVSRDVTAGLGAGVSGRSSSAVDSLGVYRLGGTLQADLNAFAMIGKFDINVGVRNVFDRQNYFPTIASTYVPLGEPRNWRVSVGYRFK